MMVNVEKCQSHYEISTTIYQFVRNLTMSEGIAEGSVVGMTLGSALGCNDDLPEDYHQKRQKQKSK